MRKNNFGFTLIELLAVITITGILLLIGIPAVSKIIFNSRKDTAETSIKRYANQANVEIKSHEISEGEVLDGTYSIMKNGYVCLATYDEESDTCPGRMLEITMDGKVPESGQVEIFNKKVVDIYNAKIDNFYVNDNMSDYVATTEPVEIVKTLCRTTGDLNYDLGTLYTCEVADGLRYDFRILSTSGDFVNLMMTSNLPGITTAWFNWGTGLGRNYNNCGPVTAYQTLSAATSGWTNLKDVHFQYVGSDIRIVFNQSSDYYRVYSKDPNCEDFDVTFTSMKARMANREEIAALSSNWYTESTVDWGADDGSGYWLNEPLPGNEYAAYAIGAPHGTAEEVMWYVGLRPVIQVSRSDLS